MKILTLIRQVPDAEARIRITDDAIDLSGAKLVIDTMDEYGLEEALRLREKDTAVEVIAVAIGPRRIEEALRTALAMGADRAIHVETDVALDAIALSKVVAQIAAAEAADLIFSGGQQADWDSQALGAAVAERLNWPQITWTNNLERDGNRLTGKHDVDDGNESWSASLPAVVTTQQGLNEPRYPTLPNIMKARKKELRKDTLDQYSVAPKLKTISSEIQTKVRLRKILTAGSDPAAAATQLVDLLRNEAKVFPE